MNYIYIQKKEAESSKLVWTGIIQFCWRRYEPGWQTRSRIVLFEFELNGKTKLILFRQNRVYKE